MFTDDVIVIVVEPVSHLGIRREPGTEVSLPFDAALRLIEAGCCVEVSKQPVIVEPSLVETQPELEAPPVVGEPEAAPALEPEGEEAPRSRRGRSR